MTWTLSPLHFCVCCAPFGNASKSFHLAYNPFDFGAKGATPPFRRGEKWTQMSGIGSVFDDQPTSGGGVNCCCEASRVEPIREISTSGLRARSSRMRPQYEGAVSTPGLAVFATKSMTGLPTGRSSVECPPSRKNPDPKHFPFGSLP